MLAVYGAVVLLTLAIVISKKWMPTYAAVLFVPCLLGLIFGLDAQELLSSASAGTGGVLENSMLLFFSVFFFSVLITAGFFERIVRLIASVFTRRVYLLMTGTVLATVLVASTGLTIGAYMVVAAAMLPLAFAHVVMLCIAALIG